MNERFVNVKVDREERPDLDAIYMDAVVALTGQGGWPMTVFLTPDGRAVLRRHVLPARAAARAAELPPGARRRSRRPTRERRDDVATPGRRARRGARALRPCRAVAASRSCPTLLDEAVERAAAQLRRGVGRLRLRARSSRPPRRSSSCCAAASSTWRPGRSTRWRRGGMYDLVGGGFHRYSVDGRWLVPHFEKMLYDNALLVPAYLHGWVVTGEPRYREVAEETLDYMLRELALAGRRLRVVAGRGHRRASRGSRTRGRPRRALPPELLEPFEHGRSILRGELDAETAGASARDRASSGRSRSATTRRSPRGTGSRSPRSRRRGAGSSVATGSTRPCARGVPARAALDSTAASTAAGGRAGRSGTGYLDDYANVAHGLYELHVATGELRWLEEARRLALLAVELFGDDERGGFFLTPADGERLVARQKDLDDNPTPSGNSMLAFVLLRLARHLRRRRARAARGLRAPARARTSSRARRRRSAGRSARFDLHFSPPRELAVIGPPDDGRGAPLPRRVGPERGRRVRPGGGRAAARGEGPRRREARGLRLRALRLPGSGHPVI